MKTNYSLAAHLVHSGLQMIWKRLDIKENMDATDIFSKNRAMIQKVAGTIYTRFQIGSNEQDWFQAVNMLHFSLQQNDPVFYWLIAHRDSYHNLSYVTTIDGGSTFMVADKKQRMTYEEASDQLNEIKSYYPKESLYLEKRYNKEI